MAWKGDLDSSPASSLRHRWVQVVVASAKTHFKNIDLDRSPVIALECGHLFTTTEMDEMLGIASAYAMLADGKFQNQMSMCQSASAATATA